MTETIARPENTVTLTEWLDEEGYGDASPRLAFVLSTCIEADPEGHDDHPVTGQLEQTGVPERFYPREYLGLVTIVAAASVADMQRTAGLTIPPEVEEAIWSAYGDEF